MAKFGNLDIDSLCLGSADIDQIYLGTSEIYTKQPLTANYITFSSPEPFTLATNYSMQSWNGLIEYSVDTKVWTVWDGQTELSSVDNKLFLRGTGNTQLTGYWDEEPYSWVLTGTNISCTGNIETLLDYKTVSKKNHPEMGEWCFSGLFSNCAALIQAPELPATTLVESCYNCMFCDCTSLTIAPELPAATLIKLCYNCMFWGCTSLVKVPELPATVLADGCYNYMFYNCTALQVSDTQTAEAPYEWKIPSDGTFLNTESYNQWAMFNSCLGTRSSDTMSGAPGESHIYYTQNSL